MIITREGFTGVVETSFATFGFAPEAAQATFPADLFWPGSDLSAVEAGIERIEAGLTTWRPQNTDPGVIRPERLVFEGADYAEALERMQRAFLRSGWTDGLPIDPPTPARVEWILTGTDRPPSDVLGRLDPRGGVVTVEVAAAALAMTRGRPEYLPVLVAAVEALVDPAQHHGRMNTTTCSTYPMVVVSGPIADEIGLGAGYGLLGPDPYHPAGGVLGRAIRLLLQDVGGAVAGHTTMAIFGGPARYTGLVFAEQETAVPLGWPTVGEEQGFLRGEDAVTVYAVASTTNIPGGEVGTEDAVLASLSRAAGTIGVPNGNYWDASYTEDGAAGFLLVGPRTAAGLSEAGWSKHDVAAHLWSHSKIPASELGPRIDAWWVPSEQIFEDPMPVSVYPEGVRIVVAGGDQSGHMMWLQSGCCPERPTSAAIARPAAWAELLAAAASAAGDE